MSMRRVVDWQIKPGEDDTYDLYLRNRQVLHDTSMTEINKHLRKNRRPDQTVHEIADDGYITDVTRRVQRRQPVSRRPARRRTSVRMPLLRF